MPASSGNEIIDIMETNQAVNSILDVEPNDPTKITDKRKRPINETGDDKDQQNKPKRVFIKRYYSDIHQGPFEVIVQDKEKKPLSPFEIGKIIKNHHQDIKFITKTGKHVTVTCKSQHSANALVDSGHLTKYNVFVPSNRIHSTGVIRIDQNIEEEEILNYTSNSNSYNLVSAQRIKRRVNGELKNTNFVKVIFESDDLPEFAYLDYVRLKVETYRIPIKQCFRCFAYGHVANSPCYKTRVCRTCGKDYHSEECNEPKKCIHCKGPHCSNDKSCPEFKRQTAIKARMSENREDYFTAGRHFKIDYKPQSNPYLKKSYAQITKQMTLPGTSNMLTTNNHFSCLEEQTANESTLTASQSTPPTVALSMNPKSNTWSGISKPPKVTSKLDRSYSSDLSQQKTLTQTKNTDPKEITPQNKDQLRILLKAKLTELKNKITTENISNKKQITDIIETYIKDDFQLIKPKQTSTTNHANRNTPTGPKSPTTAIRKNDGR